LFVGLKLAKVEPLAVFGLVSKELLKGIGLAHSLTETLMALKVILNDRLVAKFSRGEDHDMAGEFGQAEFAGTGEAAVP
jgi:hypothetical protein